MNYIIGLGNPEDEYGNTRHNAGKILVKAIADKFGVSSWKHVSFDHLDICHSSIGEAQVAFVLPRVFMNESGSVAKKIYNKEDREQVIVIHDDLDIAIGSFKLSLNKGDGGHNGVTSINQSLPNENILRLRVGISPIDEQENIRRVPSIEQADYVLKQFTQNEKKKIEDLASTIISLLEVLLNESVEKAMTLYNK